MRLLRQICKSRAGSHEAEAAGTASVSVLHKRAFLNNPKVLEVANKQLASSVHRESAHEDLLG